MAMLIPPGGFAGFAQMTPASRIALSRGSTSRAAPRRRRRSKKASASRSKVARNGRKASGRKLKFGSPAWQKKYRVGKFAKK